MEIGSISLSKAASRVWIFVLMASAAAAILPTFFPYLNTSSYYPITSKLVHIFGGYQNQTSSIVNASKQVASGSIATGVPTVLILLFRMMEGVFTGLHPIWEMLGFNKIPLATGGNLADLMTVVVYAMYAWSLLTLVGGGD